MNPIVFNIDDVGISQIFKPTRLISQVRPAKLTQKHNGQVSVGNFNLQVIRSKPTPYAWAIGLLDFV